MYCESHETAKKRTPSTYYIYAEYLTWHGSKFENTGILYTLIPPINKYISEFCNSPVITLGEGGLHDESKAPCNRRTDLTFRQHRERDFHVISRSGRRLKLERVS